MFYDNQILIDDVIEKLIFNHVQSVFQDRFLKLQIERKKLLRRFG